jgi:hypothetical protein
MDFNDLLRASTQPDYKAALKSESSAALEAKWTVCVMSYLRVFEVATARCMVTTCSWKFRSKDRKVL